MTAFFFLAFFASFFDGAALAFFSVAAWLLGAAPGWLLAFLSEIAFLGDFGAVWSGDDFLAAAYARAGVPRATCGERVVPCILIALIA